MVPRSREGSPVVLFLLFPCILLQMNNVVSGKFIGNEDLKCADKRCETQAEVNDYVRIDHQLDFGVQSSDPPHDPLCHPSFNLCHNFSGTTFLRISGTFNNKDVTHITFSSGKIQATLYVHRTGQDYPVQKRRVLYTTPPILTIESIYRITRPVQITLPFFSKELPQCTAYFGPDVVEDVFRSEKDPNAEDGVLVKWTASRSSVKIHGKLVALPQMVNFFGEQADTGEAFTFVFLAASSRHYSFLLVFVSLLATTALQNC